MGKRYSVPDKVFVVLKGEIKCPQAYTGKKFKCRPAFVTDFYAEYMAKRAREWASRVGVDDYDETVLDAPVHRKLIVVRIDHRREGGVALKAITEQGWLVDLREPEFMEAALTGTLQAGVITGEFVWTRGVTQMRLVRVGDTTYNDRIKYGNGV
ncbi:hypothetical protein N9917_00645 [Deltaproteobacteria bacterium]|nr:hypothetical protein [Deltaproteobacteria bacterium]